VSKITYSPCPYPPALGARHVLIATPTYNGTVSAAYLSSFGPSLHALRDAGFAGDHMTESYNCHVDDTRNSILREFMMREHLTDLIFIDADVGWVPENLAKLAQYDADVVAGVYPKKGDQSSWPVYSLPGEIRARADGLVEVEGVPAGFMRIQRHVVEALMTKFADRRFEGQNHQPGTMPYTIVFERTFADGHRWSGDYSFCRAWRSLGGKVFVSPEMQFGHTGEMEWTGSLADFWREQAGIDHPRLLKGLGAIYNGDASADAFADAFAGWGNHFAATSPLLYAAHEVVLQAKGPVLETGSGLSTLIMGIAAMKSGVRVHALEHDLDHFRRTAGALARYGINSVTLHYAPLRPYKAGFIWYEVPDDLPASFEIVLCDGPQQRFGRKGLYEMLSERIEGALLIVDDAYSKTLSELEPWAASRGRKVTVLGADGVHRKFAVSPPPDKMAAE